MMKFDFQLLDNPQSLIPPEHQFNGRLIKNVSSQIKAIFVPFKMNKKNINSLLLELEWYDGPIYLMPSDLNDLYDISLKLYTNVHVLHMIDTDFNIFYENLLTSRHKFIIASQSGWDLPKKRNYAIWFSIINNYNKILLIDDDIKGITSSTLTKGSGLLDEYSAVGCFVEDYPDTSVVGHLQLSIGERIKCFMSGSFLFLTPFNVFSFFPKIYNEDWIFMVPYILNKSICSMEKIKQRPYEPFSDPKQSIFQEFGEVIAEGLFVLIKNSLYNLRYEISIWSEILKSRKNELISLLSSALNQMQREILNYAIKENNKITPLDCVDYINMLEDDILTWNTFKKENTK